MTGRRQLRGGGGGGGEAEHGVRHPPRSSRSQHRCCPQAPPCARGSERWPPTARSAGRRSRGAAAGRTPARLGHSRSRARRKQRAPPATKMRFVCCRGVPCAACGTQHGKHPPYMTTTGVRKSRRARAQRHRGGSSKHWTGRLAEHPLHSTRPQAVRGEGAQRGAATSPQTHKTRAVMLRHH